MLNLVQYLRHSFSSSHAPAWECILVLWNSVCVPTETVGTRLIIVIASIAKQSIKDCLASFMLSLSKHKNNTRIANPSWFDKLTTNGRFVSRSHAPAWECIFVFCDPICIPTETVGVSTFKKH